MLLYKLVQLVIYNRKSHFVSDNVASVYHSLTFLYRSFWMRQLLRFISPNGISTSIFKAAKRKPKERHNNELVAY